MKKGKKKAITGFGVFLIATLIFAIFFYMNVETIEVRGTSMWPTFKDKQRVLVSKAYWLFGKIKDGDVVVLKDPGGPGDIIKRVKWMGGEAVDWQYGPTGLSPTGKPYRVPAGSVYVLGDNRPVSEDSRKFGAVDMKDIVGKVLIYGKGRNP